MQDADVAAYVGRWRPSSVTPQAAAFAREVVTAVAPGRQERAKNLLWAAGKLADYAASTCARRWGTSCRQGGEIGRVPVRGYPAGT